jgi:hypothetical protein
MIADQDRVDRLLRWGVLFSIVWLMGIGSAIAIINGLRARSLIQRANGSLVGTGRAWCCLIVGGIGFLLWIPILIANVVHQF